MKSLPNLGPLTLLWLGCCVVSVACNQRAAESGAAIATTAQSPLPHEHHAGQQPGHDTSHDTAHEMAHDMGHEPVGAQPEAQAEQCAHHTPLAAAAPLPGASLYNLHAGLTDQAGHTVQFESFRGQPLLMTMFYASCTSICPLLIGHLQRVEQSLPESVRKRTQVLLVSLDPERDSVEHLQQLAQQHAVDVTRWHFVRTPESSVQEIAALLGVRYRHMPDGEISHSPVIALLDGEGVISHRLEAPLGDPAQLAGWVAAAFNTTAP
jgi:protein SCO1/2